MIILFLLQSTAIATFQVIRIKPDLPLIFSFCITLINGENLGSFLGLLNGLFEDILYGRFLGFSALVKFLSNYILGYSSKNIYKGPWIITMGLTFLGTLLYNLLLLIVALFLKEFNRPWNIFVEISLYTALCNMIIAPLIYNGVVKLEKFLDHYFDIKY